MPQKWQKWMPFHIDRFLGSTSVQAMHPAARMGYLYLCAAQWQSEDCTISADAMDLAETSGLGDELWHQHSARILRKFDQAGEGRLRNKVTYEEWIEAKRVFESRQSSAKRTNTARSPHGHREVTEREPSRSADTITVTETVTETETSTEKGQVPCADAPPPGLPMFAYARGLLENCFIPVEPSLTQLVSSTIGGYAREHKIAANEATKQLTELARDALARDETVNRFWFTDRKWKQNRNGPSDAQFIAKVPEMTEEQIEEIRKSVAAKEANSKIAGVRALLPRHGIR